MGWLDRFVSAVSDFVETAVDRVSSALGFADEGPAAPVDDGGDEPEPPAGGGIGGPGGEPTLSDVLGPPDEGELGDRTTADIEREQWQAWLESSRESFSDSAYEELAAMLYDEDYDLDDFYWSEIDYDSDTDTGEASG